MEQGCPTAAISCVSLVSPILLAAVAARTQRYVLRHRAEALLADMQSIKLRQTTFHDVQPIRPQAFRQTVLILCLAKKSARILARHRMHDQRDGLLLFRSVFIGIKAPKPAAEK